jgi:hypothetical protein
MGVGLSNGLSGALQMIPRGWRMLGRTKSSARCRWQARGMGTAGVGTAGVPRGVAPRPERSHRDDGHRTRAARMRSSIVRVLSSLGSSAMAFAIARSASSKSLR